MPSAGDKVRASDTSRYRLKVTQSSTQSIGNNSFTAIQFNGTDDLDDLGAHDPVTNNTRLNLGLLLGWWLISGKYVTSGSAAGISRRARWLLNGTTGVNGGYASFPAFSATAMTGGFWTVEDSTMVQTTASADYLELTALQDSGGALATVVSGDLRSSAWCLYLGA